MKKFEVKFKITRRDVSAGRLGNKAFRLTDESMQKIADAISMEGAAGLEQYPECYVDEDDLEFVPLELKDTEGNPVPNDLCYLSEWWEVERMGKGDALAFAQVRWWELNGNVVASASELGYLCDGYDIRDVDFDDYDDDDIVLKPVPLRKKRFSKQDGFYVSHKEE